MDEILRGRHVEKKRQVSNVGHDDYRSPSFQNKTAEDPCSGFLKKKKMKRKTIIRKLNDTMLFYMSFA